MSHIRQRASPVLGIIAESLHQLEGVGAAYFNQTLPLALTCAQDEDVTCRQNGTFCLGVIGYFAGETALSAMQARQSSSNQVAIR